MDLSTVKDTNVLLMLVDGQVMVHTPAGVTLELFETLVSKARVILQKQEIEALRDKLIALSDKTDFSPEKEYGDVKFPDSYVSRGGMSVQRDLNNGFYPLDLHSKPKSVVGSDLEEEIEDVKSVKLSDEIAEVRRRDEPNQTGAGGGPKWNGKPTGEWDGQPMGTWDGQPLGGSSVYSNHDQAVS